nr:hypothetical protein Iba_chr07aCG5530 [Ipomoea batatas]
MGEMLGRSNLIDDIDLNALIVEDYIECNLPNGVESDSLVVCNASSSCFDGDHDDIPDGCNPSAGGGGTSTDANADDSSIPAIFSNVLLIIPPPVLLLPISAITSPNSTTVSAIFLKTEVTFFKDSSDNSAWTFSSILSCTRSSSRSNRGITFPLPNCPDFTSDFILSLTFSSVHDVTAGAILWFSEDRSSLKCFGDILICMYSSSGISVAVSTSFDFLCAAVVFFISALQTSFSRPECSFSSTSLVGATGESHSIIAALCALGELTTALHLGEASPPPFVAAMATDNSWS